MPHWIWQRPQWPAFGWNAGAPASLLRQVAYRATPVPVLK